MATLRQRLHRKNATGTYDVIHLETESGLVLRSDGTTVEQAITDLTPTVGESVPKTLKCGTVGINTSDQSLYIGDEDNSPVKLITELNVEDFVGNGGGTGTGGEESVDPSDIPGLSVGNNVTFGSTKWIVSHKTADTMYLTAASVIGATGWWGLQMMCDLYLNLYFTKEQIALMKTITADSTSGKVFVATKDQMNGGFSYFSSNSRRKITNTVYWTSTEDYSVYAWYVTADGSLSHGNSKSNSYGFRPSVALDLKLLG